jgi:hypothetical protein
MHNGAVPAAARADASPLLGRPMTEATLAQAGPRDADLVPPVASEDDAK